MDPVLNPYTPGSGLQPVELVGRDREIEDFDRIVARVKLGHVERGIVLSGLRGVGKTVLLRRLHQVAEQRGWMTAFIEGQSNESGVESARRRLSRAITSGARQYAHRSRRRDFLSTIGESLTGFSITGGPGGVTATVNLQAPRAGSGQLDLDLEELVADISSAVAERRSMFAVFIDEMQDLDPELLAALVTTQHLAGQQGWPFLIFGAGLPNLSAVLSDVRSYAERLFDYRTIGPIAPSAAIDALVIPAQRYGGQYDAGAAEVLVDEAQGYPYFLQQFGRATWDAAPGERIITRDDAKAGVRIGYDSLDAGFFPARWTRATQAEHRYLGAMATIDSAQIPTSSLIDTLKVKNSSELSVVRAELIRKGLIYAPRYGHVAFTVPGMAGYIERANLIEQTPPTESDS